MKRTFKKLLRTGMSLVLVASMMVGMCATAFAEESPEKINYVSLGDSMANGYCFEDYAQGSSDADHDKYDFLTGKYMYGEGAYPLQFEAYLNSLGYTVNHTKLAPSALLA